MTVDLDQWSFLVINCPLVTVGLVVNILYLLCLHKTKLKQPLKILLEFIIWNSTAFLFFVILMYGAATYSKNLLVQNVMWMLVLCNVHNSMITTAWLSFYYHIKIVPLHRAFFLWVKKNIKVIIYAALLQQEVLVCLFGVMNCVNVSLHNPNNCNGTLQECQPRFFYISFCFYIMKVYLIVCFVIMTLSNFSLFHYLRSHMKKVAQGNIVTHTMASQLRAANAAVFQGVIYISFCILYFFNAFTFALSSSLIIGIWISLTGIILYVFGTTINLGIGQTLFRERAVCIWRALTVHCGGDAPANG